MDEAHKYHNYGDNIPVMEFYNTDGESYINTIKFPDLFEPSLKYSESEASNFSDITLNTIELNFKAKKKSRIQRITSSLFGCICCQSKQKFD